MMRPRSLRWRFLIGSILWTSGLLGVAHFISIDIFAHYPKLTHVSHYKMVALALLFMAAGLAIVRRGLLPIGHLRARLGDLHAGRERRVEGDYPTEVQPLVDDLNNLLEHREHVVNRALARAGDLAHGLKTPLAVIAQEAERAEAAGQRELAATIADEVTRMRRQIDYHLAQARAAASGAAPGARCAVAVSADGLSRTLLRLHAGRGLAFDIRVDRDHAVRAQREDLDEMLGNLLDNACKWARGQIGIESSVSNGRVLIVVDDDGPGLEASMREAVLRRGVRGDEAAPGSGLGLAIVRDLAELYGGSISLGTSPAGGLRARLELPAC